jgi:predicted  nucleic acid-binding Zn-ribbon protein
MDLLGVTAEVHDLKGTVYSKSAKINELEDKITKLMVENQKLSEQLSDNLQTKFSVDSIVKRESKIKFSPKLCL